MHDADQTTFPFFCDETKVAEFLTRWFALDDEEDRIREEKRVLKEQYQDDFPMRATLTAVKIVRARAKLATHAKDPMPYAHQGMIEALVATHLAKLEAETAAVQEEAARIVPDMRGR